jgi:hypothetical protein
LAAEQDRLELEFNELLEAGQNPYEVSRCRKVQASVRAQKRHIVEALREGEERITQKLVAEEQTWRKDLAAQAKEKVGCTHIVKALRQGHEASACTCIALLVQSTC